MEKIEKAIEQLNRNIEEIQMHLFECDSKNQKETVYYRLQQDKIQDYLLARSCLQSEFDRLKGCPICLSIKQNIYRDENDFESKKIYIKDKFCYNCGRKLSGKASD